MSRLKLTKLFACILCLLLFVGCGSGNSNFQLNETGNEPPSKITEMIRLNNCGGKAATEQTAERSQTITIEGAGQIGVGIQILQAGVSARYSKSNGSAKSQTLVAPPGTNMEFVLAWTEEARLGTITTEGNSGQANYRVNIPVSVELISSRDLGCGAQSQLSPSTDSGQSSNQPPAQINTPIPKVLPTDSLPTTLPDTSPGTVLDVGQHWRQGGLELTLTEANLAQSFGNHINGFTLTFKLSSRKTQDIALRYNLGEAVSAVDNAGNRLRVGIWNAALEFYKPETIDTILHSGESMILRDQNDYRADPPPSIFVVIDTANPSLTGMIVNISVSNIDNARWRVPIPH